MRLLRPLPRPHYLSAEFNDDILLSTSWISVALHRRKIHQVEPEDDLEKLLPEGWVKKRPECVCVDCREEREAVGTGDWGPRPDQFGGRAKEPWERRYM
ncbi:hypothetical protein DE146DRAFT_287463 [Phaeosphaeria sp. MPI-PUGE-AT-0046c]|nr:hypothetical protein DE146DRAFT_287463 [Phaeosphaeria sp. MPI-PUGE-AT-0046c]